MGSRTYPVDENGTYDIMGDEYPVEKFRKAVADSYAEESDSVDRHLRWDLEVLINKTVLALEKNLDKENYDANDGGNDEVVANFAEALSYLVEAWFWCREGKVGFSG